MNNFLETRISRRGFLESGAIAAGAKASGAAAIVVQAAEALQRVQPYAQLLIPPEFRFHLALAHTTDYDNNALRRTHVVTFGDSMARGMLEGRRDDYPAALHIVNTVNKSIPDAQWYWDNEASNGATAEETIGQIKKARDKLPKQESTDIIVSAGGNNILKYLANKKPQVDRILANPFQTADVQDFVQGLQVIMTGFRAEFAQMLNAFKEMKASGIQVERVFVIGLPNMVYAQKATLPNGDEITIDGLVKKRLAYNLPRIGNIAMLQAINDEGFNAGFDIVFINSYDDLAREELTGMHPNKEGYVTLANRQLQRSYTVIRGQRLSLFDATQKAA